MPHTMPIPFLALAQTDKWAGTHKVLIKNQKENIQKIVFKFLSYELLCYILVFCDI